MPRADAGIWSSKLALKRTWVHQQGGCSIPLSCCSSIAHWLGWPHSGQCLEESAGNGLMGVMLKRVGWTKPLRGGFADQQSDPPFFNNIGHIQPSHEQRMWPIFLKNGDPRFRATVVASSFSRWPLRPSATLPAFQRELLTELGISAQKNNACAKLSPRGLTKLICSR